MTADQLEILNAIVEKGSFRAAAALLGRSQPSISVSIRNLEEELGFAILNRDEYRPRLTEQGKFFYESSLITLNEFRRLALLGHEIGAKKVETKLVVSLDPLVHIQSLTALIEKAQSQSSQTQLVFKNSILTGGVTELMSGEVDLAIGPVCENVRGIDSMIFCAVSLVPAIARDVLKKKFSNERELVRKFPQILVFHRNPDEPLDPLLPKAIHPESPKIFVSDHLMKVRLIKSGMGWGRVGLHEIEADESGTLVQLSERVEPVTRLHMCLARSLKQPLGPVGQAIWSHFKEIERSGDSK